MCDCVGPREPEKVQVPLATYTGWAVHAEPHNNDGCEGSGQYIPFAKTKAERLASGDPRLSIEERYGNFETYASMLKTATEDLVRSGFLLPVDAEISLKQNQENVLKNNLLPKRSDR